MRALCGVRGVMPLKHVLYALSKSCFTLCWAHCQRMLYRCKLSGLLTPNQAEVLKGLEALDILSPKEFFRPREIGAFRSSHHTNTLKALEALLLVEHCSLSMQTAPRPARGYRLTAQGRTMLEVFRQLADVPLDSVLGRTADRQRAAFAKRLCLV